MFKTLAFVLLLLGLAKVSAGPLAYGICQTGCNAVAFACYASAGPIFGALGCNIALDVHGWLCHCWLLADAVVVNTVLCGRVRRIYQPVAARYPLNQQTFLVGNEAGIIARKASVRP